MSSFTKYPCPSCDKSLKISADLAGQTRKCPYCQASITLPKVIETPSVVGLPSIVADDTSPPSQTTRTRKRTRSRKWYRSGNGDSANTDASLTTSGLLGAVTTVVWLVLVYPLREYQFGQLFWDRGLIPFATTFLMFWSLWMLIMKWLNVRQQRESMLLDALPVEIREEITLDSLNEFVAHIDDLPTSASESFLINRVLRGIEHFRVRKSATDTVTMMESQAAIDANNVAGSYTLLKAFIWALPILGFIGTVVGVSAAVASLASSLDSASDMSAMKGALNSVFAGLGTAFDTTLLALIMSMIVKIPTSAIQKSEEDLITSIDEYINENFLRRLNDGREGGAERGTGGGSSTELEKWHAKLDSIGTRLTSQVAKGWDEIHRKAREQEAEHAARLQRQQAEQQKLLQEQLAEMIKAAGSIQSALSTLAKQTATMQQDVNGSFLSAQSTLQERFQGLEQGLSSLSTVLTQLGDQTVVVQQAEPRPRKRGWFGGSRRSRNNR